MTAHLTSVLDALAATSGTPVPYHGGLAAHR
jgi:hypothetical protein